MRPSPRSLPEEPTAYLKQYEADGVELALSCLAKSGVKYFHTRRVVPRWISHRPSKLFREHKFSGLDLRGVN